MKSTLKLLLIPLLLCASAVSAIDWEITKIVEVGPARWTSGSRPLKFSPDGTLLAYFDKWNLVLSDTLGVTHVVSNLQMQPRKFEWLNNEELVVLLFERRGRSEYRRLIRIDISTGITEIIREHTRPPYGQQQTSPFIKGPSLSIEGNLFFEEKWKGSISPILVQSAKAETTQQTAAAENHILRWGKDGLYSIRIDLADSVRLGPKPYSHIPFQPVHNTDLTWVMVGGTMMRLSDSSFVVLDTLPWVMPDSARFHEIADPSFNPHFPEVLFNHYCCDERDDRVIFELDALATFNYVTGEWTVIDELVGMANCSSPAYAPDGCKIAFLSEGKLFILHREWK